MSFRFARHAIFATCTSLALVGMGAHAQLVVTYSTPVSQSDLPLGSGGTESVLALGYEVQLPFGFSLRPELGLVGDYFSDSKTIVSPDGYSLGVWGQYNLLEFGEASAYALGGLTFVELSGDEAAKQRSELQYAIGFGADYAFNDQISAFTNISYAWATGDQAAIDYESTSTGLELGIEISF